MQSKNKDDKESSKWTYYTYPTLNSYKKYCFIINQIQLLRLPEQTPNISFNANTLAASFWTAAVPTLSLSLDALKVK